ncbi:MAG TPA: NADH-quinone oxidoreductase subunit M [Anaerolineae bacterium]|nr:NADH-quinone oxidoreductase subunit M [Anaerolineae bacterium]
MNILLSLIVFFPLLGSIIVMLIPGTKEKEIKNFSIIISLIPFILSILVWMGYDYTQGQYQFVQDYSWIPSLNVRFHMAADGLSIPLIFLTTLLSVLSFWYSSRVIKKRVKEFFALFLMLEMGMLGVFVALDLILFYFFWEIGLVPMFLLIGIWGHAKDRPQYSAIKFFLYTLVGSVAMLLAFIAIYLQTGTWDITAIPAMTPFASNPTLAAVAFWAIFIAFAIKVPIFPFHTWLPDAHTAAPTAGSVILAGVLLKLGGYGMIRILIPFFPQTFRYFAIFIAVLGVISMIYGALVSMAQWDLKRLIAYSSVSHMGYFMLGLAAAVYYGDLQSQTIALNGAILQMFNHGIITGGLFFLVGVLYERTHTRELKAFGGLSSRLPKYYAVMMVTAFASLGLPGLAGFISELLVFRGAYATMPAIAIVGIIAIVLTAAYILWKIVQYVFLGKFSPEKWSKIFDVKHWSFGEDIAPFELITMAPLVFGMILIGVYPSSILTMINHASQIILGSAF